MDLFSGCKLLRFFGCHFTSLTCKCCLALVAIALSLRAIFLHSFPGYGVTEWNNLDLILSPALLFDSDDVIRSDKILEVPQIVWGLNNQKIAFARACLTARMLNRTLLIPSLSASLFYKEIDRLQPISFDKVFQFERFNSLCDGFLQLGCHSDLRNQTCIHDLRKGSGQLRETWSSWSKAEEKRQRKLENIPYVAIHMRVEIDWMIHCKKLEQRSGINQICSSKQEIMQRVSLESSTVIYLAAADSLLKDSSILDGWKKGLLPIEKKKLGVNGIYMKHPYLVQSAIDYEVCSRADIFVGNSFSTFSSLIVLERTQRMITRGITSSCGVDVRWACYAYNIQGESNGPQKWMTNMSDSSLKAISYGSNESF
ncbi:hypothetical protein GQ457_08G025230 [Hibiscus cannabinus]